MDTVNNILRMVMSTKEITSIINFMAVEYIIGIVEHHILGNLKMEREMVMAYGSLDHIIMIATKGNI